MTAMEEDAHDRASSVGSTGARRRSRRHSGFWRLSAPAMAGTPSGGIAWGTCADPDAAAAGWQCATFKAPRDYAHPGAGFVKLAVTRLPAQDQAQRIGAMFINYGGPGGTAVDTTQAIGSDLFGAVNDHFDLVAFDPRGVGQSSPSIDCKVNQETQGIYSKPFTTPENLDVERAGRQGQGLRQPLRAASTRASCRTSRPRTSRATWTASAPPWATRSSTTSASRTAPSSAPPTRASSRTTTARWCSTAPSTPTATSTRRRPTCASSRPPSTARSQRFFTACAVYQSVCNFGGADPQAAFDNLVDQANVLPIPVPTAGAAVNGDDIIGATAAGDVRQAVLAASSRSALAAAAAGDGTGIRDLADAFWGNNEDGTFDPAAIATS